MSKNGIIINSVDVAGCKYLFDDIKKNNLCSITLKDCKYLGNDCYYKQLQRLKVENEELKERYRLSCLECEYKNTKFENEQLKEELTALQQTYEACEKEYKRIYKENKELKELLKK